MWLHAGKPGESIKPLDCELHCGTLGTLNNGRRALRGCTRSDLPPVEWDVDVEEIGWHFGARRNAKHDHPPEPPEEGCPAGYQFAPMVSGLKRYYRQRTEHGNRVSNPFFDHCTDWLIQAAVLYLEEEEERSHSNWIRADNEVRRKALEHG